MLAGSRSRPGVAVCWMSDVDVGVPLHEQVVDRAVQLVRADAQTDGRGALRVEVDDQHLAAVLGQRGAQVDRGRRLADATLLVAQRDDAGRTVRGERRGARGTSGIGRPTASSCGSVVCWLTTRHNLPEQGAARRRATDRGTTDRSSRARVGRRVDLAQRVRGHQRVDLRRRHRGVPEQLLDHPHVGAAGEQVRRERVPQRVRRDVLGPGQPGRSAADPQDRPRALPAQPRAPRVEEQPRRPARAAGRQRRPRPHQVRVERLERERAQRARRAPCVPLPNSRTDARPGVRSTSSTSSPTASRDARARAVDAARAAPGRAAAPARRRAPAASSSRSTSSTEIAFGRRFGCAGGRTARPGRARSPRRGAGTGATRAPRRPSGPPTTPTARVRPSEPVRTASEEVLDVPLARRPPARRSPRDSRNAAYRVRSRR